MKDDSHVLDHKTARDGSPGSALTTSAGQITAQVLLFVARPTVDVGPGHVRFLGTRIVFWHFGISFLLHSSLLGTLRLGERGHSNLRVLPRPLCIHFPGVPRLFRVRLRRLTGTRLPEVRGQGSRRPSRFSSCFWAWYALSLEYVAIDTLTLLSAPGPFGDRGDTPLMS